MISNSLVVKAKCVCELDTFQCIYRCLIAVFSVRFVASHHRRCWQSARRNAKSETRSANGSVSSAKRNESSVKRSGMNVTRSEKKNVRNAKKSARNATRSARKNVMIDARSDHVQGHVVIVVPGLAAAADGIAVAAVIGAFYPILLSFKIHLVI